MVQAPVNETWIRLFPQRCRALCIFPFYFIGVNVSYSCDSSFISEELIKS